jgi:hypothetical protein
MWTSLIITFVGLIDSELMIPAGNRVSDVALLES